jgi:hypothetical protein
MITSKKYTCCFRKPTPEEKKKYTQRETFLMLQEPKDTLRESVCDKCWQSIIYDICQKDTIFTKINTKLKHHFKYIPKDMIDLITVDAFHKVIIKSHTLNPMPIEIINQNVIPIGIINFFYTTAIRLTINYLKSPRAKMLSQFRQISEEIDPNDDGFIKEYIDEKQLSPERLSEISQSFELVKKTIIEIQAELKPLHKPIKEKIIYLSALKLLAPREILETIKTKEKYSVLIPSKKNDKQLLGLINYTIRQFRKDIKAKLPNLPL